MIYEPISKLWLLNVPLEFDYTNTILFENKQKQQEYFLKQEHIVKDFSNANLTYIRENNSIVVEGNRDEYLSINYLVYVNPNFANKYYYCFINSIDYISQNSCRINISTDVFQTYIFDVTLKSALVDRFIPSKEDDLVGAFTYPEGLELGEPQISSIDMNTSYAFLEPVFVIAINGIWDGSKWLPNTPTGCTINSIPQAMSYIFTGSGKTATDWLQAINNAGIGDRIVSFFTVPSIAFNNLDGKHWALWVGNTSSVFSDDLKSIQTNYDIIELKRPTKFHDNMTGEDFIPKNAKLFTYPFSYLVNAPQGGQPKIYRYEDFVFAQSTNDIQFTIMSEITPNARLLFAPNSYKVDSNINFNEVNITSDYPTLAYVTDVFNAWLMKNENIIDLQMSNRDANYDLTQDYNRNRAILDFTSGVIGGASSMADAAIKGDYVGAMASGVQSSLNLTGQLMDYDYNRSKNALAYSYETAMQMAQVSKESLTPAGVISGSNSLAIYNGFNVQQVFCHYSIKVEFAKRIDEYFNRFGYRVNSFMDLNSCLKTRSNWNYVKTTNCIITGNIQQENLDLLKSIFNNGITLWHNPDTYLDFSQDNL